MAYPPTATTTDECNAEREQTPFDAVEVAGPPNAPRSRVVTRPTTATNAAMPASAALRASVRQPAGAECSCPKQWQSGLSPRAIDASRSAAQKTDKQRERSKRGPPAVAAGSNRKRDSELGQRETRDPPWPGGRPAHRTPAQPRAIRRGRAASRRPPRRTRRRARSRRSAAGRPCEPPLRARHRLEHRLRGITAETGKPPHFAQRISRTSLSSPQVRATEDR